MGGAPLVRMAATDERENRDEQKLPKALCKQGPTNEPARAKVGTLYHLPKE